jgi:hypothetical protein
MSNGDILASFFCGQAGAYAREAGSLEGKLRADERFIDELLQKLKKEKASVEGMVEVRKALVEALAGLNPDHPLLQKDNRTKIYNVGFERKMSSFKP